MAEYITKKQVIEWFSCYGHDDKQIRFDDLSFDIQNMAPEDVAPVVHGKWLFVDNDGYWYNECSVCGGRTENHDGSPPDFNYCPNCGARMVLEEPNETKET